MKSGQPTKTSRFCRIKTWVVLAILVLAGGPLPAGSRDNNPQLKALPFQLGDVKLSDSPFTFNRDRTLAYLKFLDTGRLLHNFRIAAGIPSSAKPCGGWEKPDCKLRGHSVGHFLSALAQAFASISEPVFQKKLDYMVSELGKCQDRMAARGYPAGFLSAYSPDQFVKLESLTPYPEIWAPYYTLHKITAGLLDAYRLAGNRQALRIAVRIADWVCRRLIHIPDSRLQEMWNLYIAGEYGGMNEVLADLSAITGEKKYLTAARKFDKKMLLNACEQNKDKLAGLHANQHIPQMTGYLRIFDICRDPLYLTAAGNFWSMATRHHRYINGGVSEGEMFREADKIASFITGETCETCCAYNLLKLTKRLYCHNPRPEYMEYYERALYNQILASQNPAAAHTAVTYFMPLNPGAEKTYSDDYDHFTCCHGTGMENHTKYQESIYFHSPDNHTLWVNLFIPSVLHWRSRGIRVIQETDFPFSDIIKLSIRGRGRFRMKIRIPAWTRKEFSVRINGKPEKKTVSPGHYLTLDNNWKDKDQITIRLPFGLRLEPLPDVNAIAGIMAGPVLMVGISDQKDWIHLRLDPGKPAGAFRPCKNPLEFAIDGMKLVPMFRAHNRPYHAYFIIHPLRHSGRETTR
jgi:DUF1680 family protein